MADAAAMRTGATVSGIAHGVLIALALFGLPWLSVREREVVGLVARGLTNREIADELVVGERTIETHVSNILGKLDLGSRRDVARWAAERGPLLDAR